MDLFEIFVAGLGVSLSLFFYGLSVLLERLVIASPALTGQAVREAVFFVAAASSQVSR